MPFVETPDGTSLFYNDWGTGKPVVLVHGWPLSADMWEYQSVFLASQGLRCISYDRRGFGRSSQPWTGYDYDTMTADLAALLDALDVRDATLVGFSMGGGEVVRYIARHGTGRVAKAVLVAAVTPFLLKTADNPDGADRSIFDQMVDGLENDRPHFLAGFGPPFYGAGLLRSAVSKDFLDWTRNLALQASPKATIDCVRAFSETDFRGDLAAVTVPTLVIHGTSDATVPIDIAGRKTAKLIAGATLKEYAGEPHGLFYTARDKLNVDLIDFIGR